MQLKTEHNQFQWGHRIQFFGWSFAALIREHIGKTFSIILWNSQPHRSHSTRRKYDCMLSDYTTASKVVREKNKWRVKSNANNSACSILFLFTFLFQCNFITAAVSFGQFTQITTVPFSLKKKERATAAAEKKNEKNNNNKRTDDDSYQNVCRTFCVRIVSAAVLRGKRFRNRNSCCFQCMRNVWRPLNTVPLITTWYAKLFEEKHTLIIVFTIIVCSFRFVSSFKQKLWIKWRSSFRFFTCFMIYSHNSIPFIVLPYELDFFFFHF